MFCSKLTPNYKISCETITDNTKGIVSVRAKKAHTDTIFTQS